MATKAWLKSPIIKLVGDQEKISPFLTGASRQLLTQASLESLRRHVRASIACPRYRRVVRLYGTQSTTLVFHSRITFPKA